MFRILELKIFRHSFFNAQTFSFINDADYSKGPYTTMLIGANGTGKSQLLEALVKVFNILIASQKKGRKIQSFEMDFELTYRIDSSLVNIKSIRNSDQYQINEVDCTLLQLPIPRKILASAINLNDRFPFYTKRSKANNDRYEYLGIRTASNNAFKNYNMLIDRFSSSLLREENLERYEKVFNLIGLKPEISIVYKAGKNLTLAKGDAPFKYLYNPDLLAVKFKSIIEKLDNPSRFSIRKDKYQRVVSEERNLEIITNFFKNRLDFIEHKKSQIKYDSHTQFNNSYDVDSFKKEAQALKLIRDLELMDVEKLVLHRKEGKYGFDQASSGEHHILSNFINIISAIEPNSLILLDEPEISLHPNWQIQYMSLLQRTFSQYTDCHFVICTHSHFLVSDLQPEKSAIVSFHIDDSGKVYNETLEYDTAGWSAENVLYRVFGVSTVRNHYLEMDLRELLSKISQRSKDFGRMSEIVESLKRFDLTSGDPLFKIIQTAEIYLEEHGY